MIELKEIDGYNESNTEFGLLEDADDDIVTQYPQSNNPIPVNNSANSVESHDFEAYESEVYKHHQLSRHYQDKGNLLSFSSNREVKRWILTCAIGLCCGLVAYCVSSITQLVVRTKLVIFYDLIDKEKRNEIPYGIAFLFYLMANVICGYIAWFVVFIEPMASGSGIPEVKCFLNGLDIKGVVKLKTLWFKIVGIIFSVASGLPLGKEGPMVHAGAIIAAAISQGTCNNCINDRCTKMCKYCQEEACSEVLRDASAPVASFINTAKAVASSTSGCCCHPSNHQDFRNDKENRDFVACGAGAGVAAAFGAPIGGVLFSLEEGASYWSTKLTWRCFFCSMTSVFAVMMISSFGSKVGQYAMFSFGEFYSLSGEKSNYSAWELFLFSVVGIMGGLIGAMFVHCNYYICKLRDRNRYKSDMFQLFEVLLVIIIMSSLSYFLPILWSNCSTLPTDVVQWTAQERDLVTKLVPLYCTEAGQYNELASLFLTDGDTAIKQLFHFREVGNSVDSTFRASALFIFFIVYVIMACVVCGLSIAAGLFVPSLLSGAAFGRLVGHVLHKMDYSRGTFADAGTYALMGAAACTGGITRITLSLSIMILEATGDMQYVLPLMATVLSAHIVGNLFSVGIDDMKIAYKKLPFLVEEEQLGSSDNVINVCGSSGCMPANKKSNVLNHADATRSLCNVIVSDVMTKNPVVLTTTMQVGDILDILHSNKHHCYPVVDGKSKQLFLGTIGRKILTTLLFHEQYYILQPQNATNSGGMWNSASGKNASDVRPMNREVNESEEEENEEGQTLLHTTSSSVLSWHVLEQLHYPNFPDIDNAKVATSNRSAYMNLYPYIDTAAFSIHESATFQRSYRMFRTLGLRQLIVVNHHHQVLGMVTRVDLVTDKKANNNAADTSGVKFGEWFDKSKTLDTKKHTPMKASS